LILAAGESAAPLDVTLTFAPDPDGLVRVSGDVVGSLPLTCNRCAEMMDHGIALGFMCTIVATEEQASELAGREPGGELDILVADGLEVSLADLVEDEILLGLPERLCPTEPCENAPEMHYPAAGQAGVDPERGVDDPAPRDNPFSVLAGLDVGDGGGDAGDSDNGDKDSLD
jgi:uncharacterized protein